MTHPTFSEIVAAYIHAHSLNDDYYAPVHGTHSEQTASRRRFSYFDSKQKIQSAAFLHKTTFCIPPQRNAFQHHA